MYVIFYSVIAKTTNLYIYNIYSTFKVKTKAFKNCLFDDTDFKNNHNNITKQPVKQLLTFYLNSCYKPSQQNLQVNSKAYKIAKAITFDTIQNTTITIMLLFKFKKIE